MIRAYVVTVTSADSDTQEMYGPWYAHERTRARAWADATKKVVGEHASVELFEVVDDNQADLDWCLPMDERSTLL